MDGPSFQLNSQRPPIALGADHDLEIFREGDPEQILEWLHERYYASFLHFFARRGCTSDTCEDLTQDTFVRLCQSHTTFDGRSKLRTWLFTIAKNVWINAIRDGAAGKRGGQEVSIDTEPAADKATEVILTSNEPQPVDHLLAKERLEYLRHAVTQLPPRMKRCASLRFDQDQKYREIATLEKVSIDTVRSQLDQARKRLTRTLQASFDKAGPDESDEEPT